MIKDSPAISDVVSKIPLDISVVLGRTSITLKALQEKAKGDFIPLDYDADDMVKIFANNKLIAKGEVVINGDQIGVVIKELIT